jgi:hypothetical protein
VTTGQSELGVTVKRHPGPSLEGESWQTHSLKGGPDVLSAVHNVCRHVNYLGPTKSGFYNDENLIITGLHCAFILFHNRAVDYAREHGSSTWQEAFAEARRLTIWHYHWLVLHEFLPLFVGQTMVDDVLQNGRQFFTVGPGEAFMPVEFQGACYRFGHSMVPRLTGQT